MDVFLKAGQSADFFFFLPSQWSLMVVRQQQNKSPLAQKAFSPQTTILKHTREAI